METSSLKLLAIDDNRDNLTALKAVVSDILPTAKVLTALNGSEGIDVAIAEDPDVILLDIVMPEMDGFEVCRRLKGDEGLWHIPVVFLTALKTDRKSRIMALEVGAEGFLAKPLDETELMAQIRAMAKIKEANVLKRQEQERLAALVGERTSELEQELVRRRGMEDKLLEANKQLRLSQNATMTLLGELKEEIEARTKGEEALRESEGRMRSIFRVAPTGIGVVSNGILLDVNSRVCEMTGYAREDLIGKSTELLYSIPDEFAHVGSEKYRQISDKGTGTVETTWKKKDGILINIILSSTPIDPNDLSKGVIFTALDITERKRAEEEREKLHAQLIQSQKMEVVGQLAGGVAHDFNNILTAIIGFGHLLMMKSEEDDPRRHYAEEIISSCEKAASIIRRLLAFCRQDISEKSRLNLNDLIATSQRMLSRLIGEDMEFHFKPCAEELPVVADPVQIEQVLMNLATNARDAMPGGGIFSIETSLLRMDEEFVAMHGFGTPGDYAVITVSDTGVGMSLDTRQRIFEPFFTTKEVGRGTGLGLSVVYGILQRHEGSVRVYSDMGMGTTFQVYLPMARCWEKSLQAAPFRNSEGGLETILVAEDNRELLDVIQLTLSAWGYTVIATKNGEEAVAKFRESAESIDLLLLDIIMPKKRGIDVLDETRSLRPDIKVLFMSGYPADFIKDRGLMKSEYAYVSKPVSPNALLRAIREVLDHNPAESFLAPG
ncbi:MAG: response regulator [Geobacteraceae bacterium]|nr:response regulator [Geobacteraceae bacterium]